MKTKTRSFFNVIKDENKRKKWILSHVTMLHVKCFFWGVGVKIYLHKHCLLYGRRPKWPDKKWKKFFSPKAPGHLFEKLPECTYLASRLGWLSDFLLRLFFSLYLISFPFVSPSVSSNSDCYFVLFGLTFFFCSLLCLRACLATVMFLSFCPFLLSWFLWFQVFSCFYVAERVLQQ